MLLKNLYPLHYRTTLLFSSYYYAVGLYFPLEQRYFVLRAVAALQPTPGSLASGGGIGTVRTRAKDDVTCSVSDEFAPPLAPNCSLREVLFLVLLYLFIPQNYNSFFFLQNCTVSEQHKLQIPCGFSVNVPTKLQCRTVLGCFPHAAGRARFLQKSCVFFGKSKCGGRKE